jgi:ribokinase
VVITLGEAGAVVATKSGEHWKVPDPESVVVDTIGAGDAFVGVLAAELAAGSARDPDRSVLLGAVEIAVRAASRSVGQPGARILTAPSNTEVR